MDIFEAARTGNIKRISELLEQGVDINSKDDKGLTALYQAACCSNDTSSLETVKFLIDHGADVNIKTPAGHTPLAIATEFSNSKSSLETVKLLLLSGANVNAQSNRGSTALLYAARFSNSKSSLETIKLLLDYGADINISDTNGYTALIIAVLFSNTTSSPETVEFLLEHGADVFHRNNENNSAIDYCPKQECRELISEYIWKRLYQRDLETASKYSKSTLFPKDVWTLILLNKRQQLLCQKLSSDKNKEVLKLFAMELNIPITKEMTKAQLCGVISRQIVHGKIYNNTENEMANIKKQMIQLARKFNIDTNRPIQEIIADINRVIL